MTPSEHEELVVAKAMLLGFECKLLGKTVKEVEHVDADVFREKVRLVFDDGIVFEAVSLCPYTLDFGIEEPGT